MASVRFRALQAGHFTMPEGAFVSPSEEGAKRTVPSLSFLIEHTDEKEGTTRILFDLGLRRVFNEYPQGIQSHMGKRQPFDLTRNVISSLKAVDLTPDDIDYVVLSHVHWDHIGMPSDFTKSKFIVGPGSLDVLAGKTHQVGTHSVFEKDLLPPERTIELAAPTSTSGSAPTESDMSGFSTDRGWQHCPDFGKALILEDTLDLFGDDTIVIVNAPGHLQGHINMLVESSETGHQVYLAADACHDRRLLTGEKSIAQWEVDGMPHCIHTDRKTAEKTIKSIAALEQCGVEVIFAHDAEWEKREEQKGKSSRLFG